MRDRRASRARLPAVGLLALCLVSLPHEAAAGKLEQWLIMPGEVVAAHAEVESECKACHAPLSDQPQAELCTACHTEVGEDVERHEGFHGRLPPDQRMECAECHAEHEGRDMKIVHLDEAAFDHAQTDFPLHGAHAGLACADCHEAGARHREADGTCVACHRAEDVHGGQLGTGCGDCHNTYAWPEAVFDHAATAFPLIGGHAGLRCETCHQGDAYEDVGRTCVACHRADDVHAGKNGQACGDCHDSRSWQTSTFDHRRATGFALTGAHARLGCRDCHQAADFMDLADASCGSCHAGDDPHAGHFGADCGACHNTRDWAATRFDHAAATGFALPAGHGELRCEACHSGAPGQALATDCGGCHAADDPHAGQLGGDCASCHAPTDWIAELWFDHDITPFPLIGAHAEVSCEQCHASAAFHDAPEDCASCHADDDPHRGTLGNQCESCHNPTDWRAWEFDHDLQTDFPLIGSHRDVACAACHTEAGADMPRAASDCSVCHSRDDPHQGRFGANCGRCHSTASFGQIEDL